MVSASNAASFLARSTAKTVPQLEKRGEERAGVPSERTFSYASLNNHLIKASLSYNIKHRHSPGHWSLIRKILFGWVANLALGWSMLFMFNLYACELFEPRPDAVSQQVSGTAAPQEGLLIAWAIASVQRFILNEPLLIFAGTGLPVVFASAACANYGGEGCGETFEVVLEVLLSACTQ